jgi:signal transduction histidine kinase/HAMP domain-containing protein
MRRCGLNRAPLNHPLKRKRNNKKRWIVMAFYARQPIILIKTIFVPALPQKYRQPSRRLLYLEMRCIVKLFRSPIIWRLVLWYLLLSLIPLGIVLVFMQRQARDAMNEFRLQEVAKFAAAFATDLAENPNQLQESVAEFSFEGQNAFLLDRNGNYLAHNDPVKIGQSVRGDLGAVALKQILSGEAGVTKDAVTGQIIGYSRLPSGSMTAVVSVEAIEKTTVFGRLSRSIIFQLSVSLLITSSIICVGIFTVLSPFLRLADFADRLGQGELNEHVEIDEMEGELKVLATSLNTMTDKIRTSIQTLEQRVAERTRDLSVASDVARQITRVLDLDILLPQLVEKTRQGFNLYYVSLFLYDQQTQELLLEVGTGREGVLMKSEAKSFHISARPSLVAQAARERKNVVINNVEQSEAHYRNPYLPETASEAVFPMLVGEHLVGTLDLQSREKDYFGEEETQIFATLAEQIAIAVRNAELYGLQTHMAEELRRSDSMKGQFLASMSHELRTPLNAIINFTEMVAIGMMGDVTDEQKDLLTQSLQSSQHLLHLINDVLDISKIQAGKLTLFLEQDVNLFRELEAVIGMASPLFANKPVNLVQDIDNNLPMITGDKRRIRQILLNLLSNAAKFTEDGVVTLSAKNRGDHVLFAVIDMGSGIAQEEQSVIFEPFTQTIDGIKKAQGTGLGLSISRSLVQAHGGDLWVESQLGEGAAFYFTLPVDGARYGTKRGDTP